MLFLKRKNRLAPELRTNGNVLRTDGKELCTSGKVLCTSGKVLHDFYNELSVEEFTKICDLIQTVRLC